MCRKGILAFLIAAIPCVFAAIDGAGAGQRLDDRRAGAHGQLAFTGRELDLAIDGPGYFVLQDPASQGIFYTRRGRFDLDDNGTLVKAPAENGRLLEPTIAVTSDTAAIHIATNGLVTIERAGRRERMEVGRIVIAKFENPSALQSIGDDCYVQTESAGAGRHTEPGWRGTGRIRQRCLETSVPAREH